MLKFQLLGIASLIVNNLWVKLTEAVMVNLIAENLYMQVDVEGHTFSVIKEIVDHHKDGHALSKEDGYLWTKSGQKWLKQMTHGWDLLCELGDQMTTWIPFEDINSLATVQKLCTVHSHFVK